MYCPYCGAQIQGSPRYCTWCGGALPQGQAYAYAADPVPPRNQPDPALPHDPAEDLGRGGKRKAPVALIAAVAAVAVALVAVVVVCVVVFGGSSTPTSATTYYTGADGVEVLYSTTTYNANGTVASKSRTVSSDDEVYETLMTYDENGNRLTWSYCYYEGSSSDPALSEVETYSYTYDSDGRPVLVTLTYEQDDEGAELVGTFAVSYEGDALSSIELTYDSESVYNPDSYGAGSDDQGVSYVVSFTVDDEGNIVQVDYSRVSDFKTMALSSVLYEYDADGTMTKATLEIEDWYYADFSTYLLLLGTLAATSGYYDGDLFVYGFVYEYACSTYEYDESGNLVAAQVYDAEGEAVADYAREYTYTYDDEGRVIECVRTLSEDGASVSYRTVYSYE